MADDDVLPRRTPRAAKAAPTARATAKKGAVAKSAAPKAPVKKAAVKKAAVKKAAVKKAVVKKAVVKKAAVKAAPAEKAPAAAKKTPGRDPGAILAPGKKAPPKLRLAAEETFTDDWAPPPAPEPVREDPHARVRGLLRDAARQVEARDARAGARPAPPDRPTPPPPAPPEPPDQDEAVTRVLVAPVAPDLDLEDEDEDFDAVLDDAFDDEDEQDEDEQDEEAEDAWEEAEDDDWAPPEELDDDAPPARSWTTPTVAPPPPPPPVPEPPTQVFTAPTPPATTPPPPAWEPAEATARPGAGAGAGISVLAIVVAVALPVLGAILGLVLSGRARARGAALAGVARVVSLLALVAWLAAAGWVGYLRLQDDGVDYSKLKVGDCFDSAKSNQVRGVKVKPCSKPHDSEIYALVNHPAAKKDPYPGKDSLVQFAADACLGQPFTEYVGVPLEQSKLKDFEIVPQASSWKDGRRVLACGVDTGGQGTLTASVKGTRR